MIFSCVPLVILFFMLGGQINKLFRPIGVPLSIFCFYLLSHKHPIWMGLPSLLYGFFLTQGYGENSLLMKWLKSEQWVRIVIGLYNTIPVIFTVLFTHNWWALLGVPVIVACSCIRMGKWGTIKLFKVLGKDFDILPVDIFRGLAVGLAMSLALI